MTLFLTFEISISFQNGNISIVKKYPMKEISLYYGNANQLKLIDFNLFEDVNRKKYVRLCSKSCEEGVYMVELYERKYLIYIDDYLFSLIEVNSDLS